MRFFGWVWNTEIGPSLLLIPNEVLAPQFKKPVVNQAIVMSPDGSYMSMDVHVPCTLRSMAAEMLNIAKLWDPDHPGLQKCSDHDLVVVGHMELFIMTPDRVVKRLPPGPYMVWG